MTKDRQEKKQNLRENLPTIEGFLRDKIGVEVLKMDLESARKSGNTVRITEAEKNAMNTIHASLRQYPWNDQVSLLDSAIPSSIDSSKRVICVGYSILMNSFLDELHIQHRLLALKNDYVKEPNLDETGHSAIRCYLSDGSSWYMDP